MEYTLQEIRVYRKLMLLFLSILCTSLTACGDVSVEVTQKADEKAAKANTPLQPLCGKTQVITAHLNKTFDVTAKDPDDENSVTLNVTGLPPDATMSPKLPLTAPQGRTIKSQFSWTPHHLGIYKIIFEVTSSSGAAAQCSVWVMVDTVLCDTNYDSVINGDDINMIQNDVLTWTQDHPTVDLATTGINDLRDSNGDNVINITDVQRCFSLCDVQNCGLF